MTVCCNVVTTVFPFWAIVTRQFSTWESFD